MPLTSDHFSGNARLSDASRNSPPLRRGATGPGVFLLQHGLLDLNYKLPDSVKKHGAPDGIYGKEMKAKVRQLQIDQELSKDGVAGEQTIARMDSLLKSISFTVPNPIPTHVPGAGAHSSANTEQAVLDTLALHVLGSINFTLNWGPSTHEGIFTAQSARIRGGDYVLIGNAIVDGRVHVEVDPGIPETMRYSIGGFGAARANTIVAKREMRQSFDDIAIIVHEATHAVCDLNQIGMVDAVFSEALAFVAECMFARKATGRRRISGVANQDAVFVAADAVARELIAGRTPDAADPLMTNLASAIGRTHRGSVGRLTQFNGIPH